MSTDCKFLNLLRRDGTSQLQRLVRALRPSYVKVDERAPGDLLAYACEYARLLRYFTPNDTPSGDWLDFIERDISVLVAIIGRTDAEDLDKAFSKKRDAALQASGDDRKKAFTELFEPLYDLARKFDDWYRNSVEGLSLRKSLDQLIRSVLAEALRKAAACLEGAKEVFKTGPAFDIPPFADVWGLKDQVDPDPSLLPSGAAASDEEYAEAVRRVADLYDRFHQALVAVVRDAPFFFKETLKKYPKHKPHIALFLAFLGLFRYAQKHLNTITTRHLDFYYKDVLRLIPAPGQPDKVHVIFELAKNFDKPQYRVAKDTVLLAGKDAKQVNVFYATDAELVVNRAEIDATRGLKTIFVEKIASGNETIVGNIYAAEDGDSGDGRGGALEDPDGKWLTFGGNTMPYAQVGFAIASPMFLLAEGSRTITVEFHVDLDRDIGLFIKDESHNVAAELLHSVKAQASGEKKWMDLKTSKVEITKDNDGLVNMHFELSLGPEFPPVVGYDSKNLAGGFDTTFPVIRFLLDNEGLSAKSLDPSRAKDVVDYFDDIATYPHLSLVRFERRVYEARLGITKPGFRPGSYPQFWRPIERSYPYKHFQGMELKRVVLTVDVDGVRNLILENDFGVLDPAKPFHPFGPIPRAQGSFLIGSHEVFQKPVENLTLHVEWADLPTQNFSVHYTHYNYANDNPIVTANDYFTAGFSILKQSVWQPSPPISKILFQLQADAPSPWRDFALNNISLTRDPALKPFQRFDPKLRQGFLKATLEKDFLHSMYPGLLAKFAKEGGTPPNAPYTPLIASLSLDYSATQDIDFSKFGKDDFKQRIERIFQIGPFGHREIYPIADDPAATDIPICRKLVPEFDVTAMQNDGRMQSVDAEGTLYIGLANLKPPQNVSLLFQVAEGSEDPNVTTPPKVVWAYLASDRWVDFTTAEIVADGTNGLLASGIMQFSMPKTMTDMNTSMPAGLHWIKASVANRSVGIPKLIAIRSQAVVASFRDQGNDPARLASPLLAGTISKLKNREAAIKSVSQPYASFGGRMPETAKSFYIRTSERLRHKRRAVSIFDYERLVLRQFPEVYKLKCINHTRADSECAPGCVRIVVMPNLRNRNAVDPLHPRLSLNKLERIRDHLADFASDFVAIEVANPDYEDIRVRFNVRFRAGKDKGYYTAQLNQDIIRFLSPWLYDEAGDLTFGGRIHRSAILNWIEERDYVDFVTDFQMDQIVGTRVLANVEEAKATSSGAALVSAPQHGIGDDIVSCEDKTQTEATPAPPPIVGPGPIVVPSGFERYLGNSRVREMHDLLNVKRQCQVDEIAPDRRFYFADLEAGLRLGYDYCAYCFDRERSKR